MAKYTITIKSLLDNNFDFGLNNYPIFDENYRDTLNQNILYHYYENEIGFETANLFKFYLNQKMNEIMPYYNILYNAQKDLIDNNVLFDSVNLRETFERENETETETSSSSQSSNTGYSDSKNLYQDTPQGNISNTDIDHQTWATNLNLTSTNTSNSIEDESSSSGNANTTENYIKSITGNNGGRYNVDILNEIKNNIMNIDLMIINDLNDLFMQIF